MLRKVLNLEVFHLQLNFLLFFLWCLFFLFYFDFDFLDWLVPVKAESNIDQLLKWRSKSARIINIEARVQKSHIIQN